MHGAAVAAGEEAKIEANGQLQHRPRADMTEALAWQQRKLIFKRTALD
jgi:ferric-dicitrate binding protein FerR (iron transport regulator)